MVTCQPDIIAFPCIKLSQYSNDPAEIHYKALLAIFSYLAQTVDDSIYYWRKTPNNSLPIGNMPRVQPENHITAEENKSHTAEELRGYVDSDWAGDTKHR